MPRKKREWFPGACYHVMGRGNRHCAIFHEHDDYLMFMKILGSVQVKYPFVVNAYCLMTNHFHIELTTKDDPIWKIMQPVMNNYARTFNQKYGHDGHLFDSRYASGLIEDDMYYLEVSRYIHLNPVKAMMVREPLAYRYSSYGCYVGDDGNDLGIAVDISRAVSCFRNNPKEQYRMFVEGKLSHAEQELLIQKDMKEDDMWLPW